MNVVDLRSDTLTKPTPEMRTAMYESEVGDDVWGEDPTVIKLQNVAAAKFGKEAALYVPSGTMGNLIAVACHCDQRDSEVLLGDYSHIHIYEQGNIATIAGVHPRPVKNLDDGTLDLDDLEAKVRADNCHYPVSRLVCVENTQNYKGGRVIKPEYMDKLAAVAKKHGLKIHLDGARIFNAATALNLDVKVLTKHCDSISCCLSKGLAAPVGSLLIGSKAFIAKALRMRKALGGGMRQCGVLAAPGLISLDQMSKRLDEDHATALHLAKGVLSLAAKHPAAGVSVDLGAVESNIVNIKTSKVPAAKVCELLAAEVQGLPVVRCGPSGPDRIRACTYYSITMQDIDNTLMKLAHVMSTL